MRFITEFKELHPDFIHRKAQDIKIDAERDLGHFIAKIFGWQNPSELHHRLEIEAFPMEKWIEFKANILNISDLDSIQYKTLIDLISELESFGKPAADTITNQKLTNDRTE